MTVDETINLNVFVAQTTYYIYRCEEDRQNDRPFLVTSDKSVFELYKEQSKQSSKITDNTCMICGDIADTKNGWTCKDCRTSE